MQAAYDSLRLVMTSEADTTPRLNPALQYLRVGVAERTAYLALGYRDPHPAGEVEVWYSAKGEVLKLQGGRIVGTAGLETDWREVRQSGLPRWADIPAAGASYRRERDLMPGYRTAVREQVRIRPIAVPAHSALRHPAPQTLRWFEESSMAADVTLALPAARFAVDVSAGDAPVVYSEQCLSATLCLTLQRWSVAQDGSAAVSLGHAR